jgi:hypothetical protein
LIQIKVDAPPGRIIAAMSPRFTAIGLVVAVLAVAALAAEVAASPAPVAVQPTLRHPVVINQHPAPRVRSGAFDHAGQPATIACSTCHAVRTPNPANRASADLDQFHQGLQIAHGMNSCLSCHDANDYDNLKLADGRKVSFTDSIELCSQCHGPQRRDYDRGAHGGMNGYWDLSKGGRVRNTCIDCHDPHVPKYQGVLPMPHARDRFQQPQGAAHD